ncbi:MAG: XRE family transcriptional regulator [Clostridiales bacterium]|nr:XRE family transcriptional regulator [Clostridiales bacterium]
MFSEELKKLRISRGLTQQELADELKLSRSAIGMYENGERTPDIYMINLIADFFNVSTDSLIGRKVCVQAEGSAVLFPVLNSVCERKKIYDNEIQSDETVEIPRHCLNGEPKENFFVLAVNDDFMYPMFQNGDKVLILKQEEIYEIGAVGAVIYNNSNAVLRKIEYSENEKQIKLIPINPLYPPEIIENKNKEKFHIIGIPKLLIRKFA